MRIARDEGRKNNNGAAGVRWKNPIIGPRGVRTDSG